MRMHDTQARCGLQVAFLDDFGPDPTTAGWLNRAPCCRKALPVPRLPPTDSGINPAQSPVRLTLMYSVLQARAAAGSLPISGRLLRNPPAWPRLRASPEARPGCALRRQLLLAPLLENVVASEQYRRPWHR